MAVIAAGCRCLRSTKFTYAHRSRSLHTGQTAEGARSDRERRATSDREYSTGVVCNITKIVTHLGLVLGEFINGQLGKLIHVLESELAVFEQVQEAETLECDSDLFGSSATDFNESCKEVSEDLPNLTVRYFGD